MGRHVIAVRLDLIKKNNSIAARDFDWLLPGDQTLPCAVNLKHTLSQLSGNSQNQGQVYAPNVRSHVKLSEHSACSVDAIVLLNPSLIVCIRMV